MNAQPSSADVAAVAALFRAREPLLVVTGAGISLASGIPTFRGEDPGAIWKRDVTELGTLQYFEEDPVGSWRWYLSRFSKTLGARPNAAHLALVELEQSRTSAGDGFLLVTQNIDGLHRLAGSRQLIEVHGRSDRLRCPRHGCTHGAPTGSLPRADFDLDAFAADPTQERLPRCPACRSILRQHVLWFDETYDSHDDYGWPSVLDAAGTCAAVVFVGTSFSVGVTELILTSARRRRRPVISVDPSGAAPPGVRPVVARAEELLPLAVAASRIS
jgi:NAD-dependent deacetylase